MRQRVAGFLDKTRGNKDGMGSALPHRFGEAARTRLIVPSSDCAVPASAR